MGLIVSVTRGGCMHEVFSTGRQEDGAQQCTLIASCFHFRGQKSNLKGYCLLLSIMSSSFGDLLQQAEQLTADMDSGWELPRVERNLHQLAEAGQRLWAQTTGAVGDNAAVKA